jgi:polysaccharide pyruvyl transferase WcaK-like protein
MDDKGKVPLKIVFLGTHGQRNIGDELLLETFLHQLGPSHRYVVNTYDKAFTRNQLGERCNVELIDTAGDRRLLLRHLLSCDLLCFGGGSIIKELYKSTGRNRYATLLMILATVTFANIIGRKPIAMLNIGVGPITSRTGSFLARLILRQTDLLTVRDQLSHSTCSRIGLDESDILLATDAVFSADASWLLGGADAMAHHRSNSGPTKVAFNLNYDIENRDNWEYFLEQLAAALLDLNERHPIELHAVPMQAGFKEHDDVSVLDDFAARVPSIVMHAHRPTTFVEAAHLIAECDVLLSERLHAIIMASILGVPTYALAYDVKVSELASMLDIGDFSVDINQCFSSHAISDGLAKLIVNQSRWTNHLLERSTALRDQARSNCDATRQWVDNAIRR